MSLKAMLWMRCSTRACISSTESRLRASETTLLPSLKKDHQATLQHHVSMHFSFKTDTSKIIMIASRLKTMKSSSKSLMSWKWQSRMFEMRKEGFWGHRTTPFLCHLRYEKEEIRVQEFLNPRQQGTLQTSIRLSRLKAPKEQGIDTTSLRNLASEGQRDFYKKVSLMEMSWWF